MHLAGLEGNRGTRSGSTTPSSPLRSSSDQAIGADVSCKHGTKGTMTGRHPSPPRMTWWRRLTRRLACHRVSGACCLLRCDCPRTAHTLLTAGSCTPLPTLRRQVTRHVQEDLKLIHQNVNNLASFHDARAGSIREKRLDHINPHRTQRDVKSGVIWWATKLSNEDMHCGAAALHHGTPCYRTADVSTVTDLEK